MSQASVPPLQVIVVDDEPLARARMKMLLSDIQSPRSLVAGECGDAVSLMASLDVGEIDVVLLDINMPGESGLQVASRIKGMSLRLQPAIVFVTAHGDHALDAFELEVLDYLTKPVRRERLQAALERVARRRMAQQASASEPLQLVASERGHVVRIPVHEILYLRAEQKYVTLRTPEREWTLEESLTELETRLGAPNRFVRVHRNALVSTEAVSRLEKRSTISADETGETWAVHIEPLDEWLAVSRRQLAGVREALALKLVTG